MNSKLETIGSSIDESRSLQTSQKVKSNIDMASKGSSLLVSGKKNNSEKKATSNTMIKQNHKSSSESGSSTEKKKIAQKTKME